MGSDKKKTGSIEVEGGIEGDGIIVGHGDSSVRVTKISTEVKSEALAEAFAEFLRQVKASHDTSPEEQEAIERKAKAAKNSLESSDPDLGKIQQFKKFLLKKGGTIGTAASKLFSHPAVVAVISTTLEKLIE